MKVLFLGHRRENLRLFFKTLGDEVIWKENMILADSPVVKKCDFLVSYGYRYILKKEVLNIFYNKAINLHISLLPWNRGADPNLWSFLENTPKGVTIHQIDSGIDTGKVIAQKEIFFSNNETLKTSYEVLSNEIENLFRNIWPEIRKGKIKAKKQIGRGSFHFLRDRSQYEHLLSDGWNTPVSKLVGKALDNKEFSYE